MEGTEIGRAWLAAKTTPLRRRRPVTAPPNNLIDVLDSLLQRRGYDLDESEQRVLRACLVLAGAPLPLRGICDLEFFVALENYQKACNEEKTGLSTYAIGRVIAAASHVVGATGRFRRVRAARFDAFEAPRRMNELSSLALLIRALRDHAR